MEAYLILQKKYELKLLEFMLNAVIRQDAVHKMLGLHIDIEQEVISINTHLSVESGINIHYQWPFIQSDVLQDMYFEVPAAGFVNILSKLGNEEPIWCQIKNEQKITLSTYKEQPKPQPSLFGEDHFTPPKADELDILYEVDIKPVTDINQFTLPISDKPFTFSVNSTTLSHHLKLVLALSKLNSDEKLSHSEIIIRPQISSKGKMLEIVAGKQEWYCFNKIPITTDCSNDGGVAHIAIKHLTPLTGLLVNISDNVNISLTHNHLSISKNNWRCSFLQSQSTWDDTLITHDIITTNPELFSQINSFPLLDLLPRLCVADHAKKTRLLINATNNENEVCFSVQQNNVLASQCMFLPNSTMLFPKPISISLLALIHTLSAFKDNCTLYHNASNGRIIISDKNRVNHVVLLTSQLTKV